MRIPGNKLWLKLIANQWLNKDKGFILFAGHVIL